VDILCTVSLRVYSGTRLPIFIEIYFYLTDTEQKKSWHTFYCDTVNICIRICTLFSHFLPMN